MRNMHFGAWVALVVGAAMVVAGVGNCFLHTMGNGQSFVAFIAAVATDPNVTAGLAALGLTAAHASNATKLT